MNWEDKITSKGQTEPTIWVISSGSVSITLVMSHRIYCEDWIIHCSAIGLDTKPIGKLSEMSLEQAQQKAIKVVKHLAAKVFTDVLKLETQTNQKLNKMSKTNFTPGPWKVNPKAKMQVCTEKGEHGIASCGGQFEYVQACENALLIAAAPEMYALLSRIMEIGYSNTSPMDTVLELSEMSEEIENALMKARGENTNQPQG